MGQSWAILFAWAGYRVCVFDPESAHVMTVFTEICKWVKELDADGATRRNRTVDDTLERISVTNSLTDCVTDSIYIQECLPGDSSLRSEILKQVDGVMGADTIVGSSGMTLPSLLSADLTNRRRFLTAHPVDPLIYTTCVELVPAPWTATESCDRTSQLMANIGQTPVMLLREQEGFAACGIESAILEAGYQLIKDGVCDVADVETGMTEGLGMWYWCMGMFDVQHLNRNGWQDFCIRGGDMVLGIQKDINFFERMGGDTARNIEKDLSVHVPLDQLQKGRRWRDRRLSSLIKFKNTLEQRDSQDGDI
ncbi:lambda-crystallin homolog isoform X2 [Gigantopelta aegis]|nr:lambda-crystallin homolog isoform X2 [Gigantopelta aegis]